MVLPILRRSLAVPPTTINSTFILGAKKLVFEYCETWGSNEGMKKFILNDMVGVAERYPGVEMVVRRVDHRHPHLRGLYGQSSLSLTLSESVLNERYTLQ